MEIRCAKQALRRKLREQLKALDPAEKSRLDAQLAAHVTAHPYFQEADTLLCYAALPFEPDTRRIIEAAWSQGKRTAFPLCTAPGEMQFYMVMSRDDLTTGAYGIAEPTGRELPVITEKTLCLVPAFAFTADGRRLGKGGGYYDRYLSAHTSLRTLGLTYACILQEDIPCEAHDTRVSEVVF